MKHLKNKSSIYKFLNTESQNAHDKGDEGLSNKLYELGQDTIFDNYLTVNQIKTRYQKILEN